MIGLSHVQLEHSLRSPSGVAGPSAISFQPPATYQSQNGAVVIVPRKPPRPSRVTEDSPSPISSPTSSPPCHHYPIAVSPSLSPSSSSPPGPLPTFAGNHMLVKELRSKLSSSSPDLITSFSPALQKAVSSSTPKTRLITRNLASTSPLGASPPQSPPFDSVLSLEQTRYHGSPPQHGFGGLGGVSGTRGPARVHSRSFGNIPLPSLAKVSANASRSGVRSDGSGADWSDEEALQNHHPSPFFDSTELEGLHLDDPPHQSGSQVRFQPHGPDLSFVDTDGEALMGSPHQEKLWNKEKEKAPSKRFALKLPEERRALSTLSPRGAQSPTREDGRRRSNRSIASSGTASPPATQSPTNSGKIRQALMLPTLPNVSGLYSSSTSPTSPISPALSPREFSPPMTPSSNGQEKSSPVILRRASSVGLPITSPKAPVFVDVLTQSFRKSLVASNGTMELSTDPHPVLRATTFNRLVEWALFAGDESDDSEMKALLCTYRTYGTPKALLDCVMRLFRVYCRARNETLKQNRALNALQSRLTKRVVSFVKIWLENWYEVDIEGKAIASKVVGFIDTCIPTEERATMKLLLVKKNYAPRRKVKHSEPTVFSPRFAEKENAWLAETSSRDIAEQLTLFEAELFQAIRPAEFVDCPWQKEGNEKSMPNLQEAVAFFNRISHWVTTCIVTAGRPEKQAWMLRKFIAIAKRLYELRNWNGVMEITVGLGNCAVTRLRTATKLLGLKDREVWNKLEGLIVPTANYRVYRSLAKELPSLPVLAVLQRDLLFMYDGNPHYLGPRGDLINVEKMRMIGGAIQDFVTHVQKSAPTSNITLKKKIRHHLKHAFFLSTEALYQHSLACEPSQSPAPRYSWSEDGTASPQASLSQESNTVVDESSEPNSVRRRQSSAESSSWTPNYDELSSFEEASSPVPHPDSFGQFEFSPLTSPRKDDDG